MELVLGHVTWYQNLRNAVTTLDTVDAHWVETRLYDAKGVLEKVPGVPPVVRAGVRAWLDVHRGLRHRPRDLLIFNTQKAAMLCQADMLRTPTILMTDVTPLQYDRLARLYEHEAGENGAIRLAKHRLNVLNFRLARGLVVCSTWVRDSLVDEYGVAPERVHVMPIGVDPNYWRPAPSLRTEHGKVRLLFVGGNFERKGGRLLLDIFRELQLHQRAELHVVTRDAIDPQPGVVVHNNMANNSPDLLKLYQQADIFVLPTLADCFSNASLEAMAAGLPVITTAMAGIPDIVEPGRTGYLLPPGEAAPLAASLRHLVDDESARRAFGAAGRARVVARFDSMVNAGRILEVARTLAAENRHPTPVPSPAPRHGLADDRSSRRGTSLPGVSRDVP